MPYDPAIPLLGIHTEKTRRADLFRSNSGAMWEQSSVNTERAMCLCMEHGSLTGHLTWASCPIIMPPPPAISSTPNVLCSRPVLERGFPGGSDSKETVRIIEFLVIAGKLLRLGYFSLGALGWGEK